MKRCRLSFQTEINSTNTDFAYQLWRHIIQVITIDVIFIEFISLGIFKIILGCWVFSVICRLPDIIYNERTDRWSPLLSYRCLITLTLLQCATSPQWCKSSDHTSATIYHVASQSSWINKTIGHHTEEGSKRGFKVRPHLSGVNLVVMLQRHLSRGLPVFVNKQDNRSSHRGGQKDRLQSANSPQWCKSCGHTSTTFITWPPSLRE